MSNFRILFFKHYYKETFSIIISKYIVSLRDLLRLLKYFNYPCLLANNYKTSIKLKFNCFDSTSFHLEIKKIRKKYLETKTTNNDFQFHVMSQSNKQAKNSILFMMSNALNWESINFWTIQSLNMDLVANKKPGSEGNSPSNDPIVQTF